MRIFAGDRVKSLMERMGMPDDEPIEHPWVTKSIRDAQGKVEARNFDIRKNLLEYDDVMNEQRKTVYKIRQQLLLGIYTPEILDEDGKATGKMREIETLAAPRRRREARPSRDMRAPLRDAGAAARARRRRSVRRRSTRSNEIYRHGAAPDRHLPVLGIPLRLQGEARRRSRRRSTSA